MTPPSLRGAAGQDMRHCGAIAGALPSAHGPDRRPSSLDNLKLERDAIVLYDSLARIEKDPRPRRRVPPDRGQRAPPRRGLGDQAARARRRRPGVRSGRGRGSASSSSLARLFGTKAVADLVDGARGRRGGRVRRPGVARGRGHRRGRARARPDLGRAPRRWRARRGRSAAEPGSHGGGDGRGSRRRVAGPPGRRPVRDRRGRELAPDGRPVRDAPGRDLRGQRRPRQQPRAGHGRRRCGDRRRAAVHPPRRHRRAARRLVQHGRRRVHLDAEPARAVRAPDRARAGRDGGDARGGGGRARRRLPVQGLHRRRGGTASPTGSSRTRRPRSTRSSARSWASTPIELGSPVGAAARVVRGVRDRRDRSRSSRSCSVAAPRSSPSAWGSASSRCSRSARPSAC